MSPAVGRWPTPHQDTSVDWTDTAPTSGPTRDICHSFLGRFWTNGKEYSGVELSQLDYFSSAVSGLGYKQLGGGERLSRAGYGKLNWETTVRSFCHSSLQELGKSTKEKTVSSSLCVSGSSPKAMKITCWEKCCILHKSQYD